MSLQARILPTDSGEEAFFIDGGLVATLGRTDVVPFGADRVTFGDPSSFLSGSITRYNSVEFVGIPEPATFILLLVGVLAVVFRRAPIPA